jgi:hypothetical protein
MPYKRKTKTCRNCRIRKLYSEFYTTDTGCGRSCFRSICKVCDKEKRRKRWTKRYRKFGRPLYMQRYAKIYAKRRKVLSKMKKNWYKAIYADSRKSDRKKGFYNNLTKEFIKSLISHGCSYCGETKIRMTMDRIDNNKGHTRKNVREACTRCNYMRRDMPYSAWLCVVPFVRRARKAGLFSSWIGNCAKRKNKINGGFGHRQVPLT